MQGLRSTNGYTIGTKLVIEKITRLVLKKSIVIVFSGYIKSSGFVLGPTVMTYRDMDY